MSYFDELNGRVAIVTGGTSGIGRAIALVFASAGIKVVLSGRNEQRGNAVVEQIKSNGGEAYFYRCDTGVEEQVKNLVDFTVEKYGKLNIMVNNAGIGNKVQPLHEMSYDEYSKVMKTNVDGTFFGLKYGIEAMLKTKSEGCSVINMGSGVSLQVTAGLDLYSASKHAMASFTKTTALEYAKYGITVNAICPGTTKTEIFDNVSEEQMKIYTSMCPNGRLGLPEEVGYLALFLASDMARNINGTLIPIDGGYLAGYNMPVKWAHPEILD